MYLPITTSTAVVLGLWFIILSSRTILMRREKRINLGDGGDPSMLRVLRAHANLSEYAPMMLILLLLAEMQTAHTALLSFAAVAFIAGRLIHGYVFSFSSLDTGKTMWRVAGMALTLTPMLVAIIVLVL